MTETLSQQAQQSQLVKPDPGLAALRAYRKRVRVTFYIVALVICATILITLFLDFSFETLYGFFLQDGGIAFGIPLLFLALLQKSTTRQIHFREQLEQRRQAAAQGEQSLLAAEQPTPDTHALSLPFTIQHRPTASILILPLIIGMLLAVMVGLMFFLTPVFSLLGSLSLPLLAIVVLFPTAILSWKLYLAARVQMTITEDGLILVGLRSKVHHVSWRDARLFAIDDMAGTKKYPHPIQFELASADQVVRWTWLRSSSRNVIYLSKALATQEEFDRCMQALHSLIVARTGLPLYDLRKR